MSINSSKCCWICLNNNNDDNISDARHYTDIFIQLTNNIYCKDLMLCMWCKTILKKTINLKNLALKTEKFIHAHNEVLSPISTSNNSHLHRFSVTAVTHIDVPSHIKDRTNSHIIILNEDDEIKEENQSSKQINKNVIYLQSHNLSCTVNELNLNKESNQRIYFLTEEIEYQNENVTPHINDTNERQPQSNDLVLIHKNENEKESTNNKNLNKFKYLIKGLNKRHMKNEIKNEKSVKQSRIDLKLEELKFEVRYLTLEEQTREIERKTIKYKDMKFQCDMCGVGFLTNDYFEAHQVRHTEAAGQYKCSVCSLHFRNQLVISQHMLSHRRLFSCMVCGAQFTKWSNCAVHRQKCGGLVTYVECEICSKVFSDAYSLKVHTRVHNLKKQYSCEQCATKFKTKQRLAVHIRSHTGAKPFSCSFCSRSFTTNSNLRAHHTVHSDVCEHYCVECNTYYKTAKSLKRHLNESVRHIRDRNHMYKCKECSKEFGTVKSLESHVARHANGQEVSCPHCNKTFSSKSNLTKHLKCLHKSVSMTPSEK